VILFAANIARVGVLVVVAASDGWRVAAEMLHVPLGVLGFILACAAAVVLLRRLILSILHDLLDNGTLCVWMDTDS